MLVIGLIWINDCVYEGLFMFVCYAMAIYGYVETKPVTKLNGLSIRVEGDPLQLGFGNRLSAASGNVDTTGQSHHSGGCHVVRIRVRIRVFVLYCFFIPLPSPLLIK